MLEEITRVIRAYKCDDDLQVTENTTFQEIGLDSLHSIQLITELEDAFGVPIRIDSSVVNISAVIEIIETAKQVEPDEVHVP